MGIGANANTNTKFDTTTNTAHTNSSLTKALIKYKEYLGWDMLRTIDQNQV